MSQPSNLKNEKVARSREREADADSKKPESLLVKWQHGLFAVPVAVVAGLVTFSAIELSSWNKLKGVQLHLSFAVALAIATYTGFSGWLHDIVQYPTRSGDEVTIHLCKELRMRAARLRQLSLFLLGLVLVSVCSSLAIFAWAGSLTKANAEGARLDGSATWYQLELSSIVIRVSITVLALYLSRILLHTYRYNFALGAFYDAKADVLQLQQDVNSADFLNTFQPKGQDLTLVDLPESPVVELTKATEQLSQGLKDILKIRQDLTSMIPKRPSSVSPAPPQE